MSYDLKMVLKKCSDTASWYGLDVSDVKAINLMDDTPLHTVCTWGDLESVQTLINAGADVNAKGDNGVTPLFNAVISGNPKLIELLVKSGAILSLKNDDGRSVLEYAKNIQASISVVDLLKKLTNQ